MMAICCNAHKVGQDVFFSKSRKQECINVRHSWAYNMQKSHKRDVKLQALGQYIGKDHTTIINSRDKWADWLLLKSERGVKQVQQRIEAQLPKSYDNLSFIPIEDRIANLLHQKQWAMKNGHAHIVNICMRELRQIAP